MYYLIVIILISITVNYILQFLFFIFLQIQHLITIINFFIFIFLIFNNLFIIATPFDNPIASISSDLLMKVYHFPKSMPHKNPIMIYLKFIAAYSFYYFSMLIFLLSMIIYFTYWFRN